VVRLNSWSIRSTLSKGELADLSGELIQGLGDRLRGLTRFDRTERLTAAHRVIVLTAYFEALREVRLPFSADDLRLSRSSQVALATGQKADSEKLQAIASILTENSFPDDVGFFYFGGHRTELRDFYASIGDRLAFYLEGLSAWGELGIGSRSEILRSLADSVPATATRLYAEHLRRLAVEFPEVAFWADRLDHTATRASVQELATGLEGLGRTLDQIASGRLPDDRRESLAASYRKNLQRLIAPSGDIPEGLAIPTLAQGYVNPRYRAAWVSPSVRIDQEAWCRLSGGAGLKRT
jgi:hypothetical protein